jgi:hypothetical protein
LEATLRQKNKMKILIVNPKRRALQEDSRGLNGRRKPKSRNFNDIR